MHTGRFEATIGAYRLTWDRGRPYTYGYDQRRKHATLLDEIAVDGAGPQIGMLSVGPADSDWPILVIEHGHVIPWTEDLLALDVLLVPETHILFVGAHESVLAYDLTRPTRLWTDTAEAGFHAWRRHGRVVLMSAELELVAWDIYGRKLWATFVEPPYDYTVTNDTVHLTVLDVPCSFPLSDGPSWGGTLPWIGH